MTVTSKTPVST